MKNLENIIITGTKVLIREIKEDKSLGGIILPETADKEKVTLKGFVVKTGPGFLVQKFDSKDSVDDWIKEKDLSDTKHGYIPIEAKIGDIAVFVKNMSLNLKLNGDDYLIVPNEGILLLEREDVLNVEK